jgi:nucleotide-binding universal stress UspA family protein
MMDQKNAPTKVLMVQDGEYMQQVTDYAMKMAQRLDCEIIALDVTDTPLQFSGDRRKRETERFMDMAKKNAATFTSQAQARGLKVEHLMDVGIPEEVIARVSAEDAGVRYVLSKPEGERAEVEQERAHVPVFDLRCSRL